MFPNPRQGIRYTVKLVYTIGYSSILTKFAANYSLPIFTDVFDNLWIINGSLERHPYYTNASFLSPGTFRIIEDKNESIFHFFTVGIKHFSLFCPCYVIENKNIRLYQCRYMYPSSAGLYTMTIMG